MVFHACVSTIRVFSNEKRLKQNRSNIARNWSKLITRFPFICRLRHNRGVFLNLVHYKNRSIKKSFHLTSWRPCWCTPNKRILIISFVWDTKMAAVSIVFCVSWDCVKTKNCNGDSINELTLSLGCP